MLDISITYLCTVIGTLYFSLISTIDWLFLSYNAFFLKLKQVINSTTGILVLKTTFQFPRFLFLCFCLNLTLMWRKKTHGFLFKSCRRVCSSQWISCCGTVWKTSTIFFLHYRIKIFMLLIILKIFIIKFNSKIINSYNKYSRYIWV